jgi:hypothetical protein
MNKRLGAAVFLLAGALMFGLSVYPIFPHDCATRTAAAAEAKKPLQKDEDGTLDLCHRNLANPNAAEEQWVHAAERIVRWQPITSVWQTSRTFVGEPLRTGMQPSVSDLLSQRTQQLTGTRSTNNSRRLTAALAKWDIDVAIPFIRRQMLQIRSGAEEVNWSESRQQSEELIAGIDAGAEDLIDEYIAWIERLKPDAVPFDSAGLFRPIGRYPEHPKLQQLAKKLFSESSAWLPLLPAKDFRKYQNRDDLIASSLVSNPEFRDLLGRMLRDETLIGTCRVEGKVGLRLTYSNKGTLTTISDVVNADDLQRQEEVPLRVCDVTAWKLSGLAGAPHFEPYWSEFRRSETLPLMSRFLEMWGHAFRDRGPAFNAQMHDCQTAFYLPPLDHVGSLTDVAEARAIFSHEVAGTKVRTVALSTYPQPGRWKKQTVTPDTSDHQSNVKSGDGYIFQAEDVRENGFWKRYYGFCGTHVLARIPASEIEFLK